MSFPSRAAHGTQGSVYWNEENVELHEGLAELVTVIGSGGPAGNSVLGGFAPQLWADALVGGTRTVIEEPPPELLMIGSVTPPIVTVTLTRLLPVITTSCPVRGTSAVLGVTLEIDGADAR